MDGTAKAIGETRTEKVHKIGVQEIVIGVLALAFLLLLAYAIGYGSAQAPAEDPSVVRAANAYRAPLPAPRAAREASTNSGNAPEPAADAEAAYQEWRANSSNAQLLARYQQIAAFQGTEWGGLTRSEKLATAGYMVVMSNPEWSAAQEEAQVWAAASFLVGCLDEAARPPLSDAANAGVIAMMCLREYVPS